MQRFSTNAMAPHEIEHNRFVRENGGECALFLKRNDDFPVQPCAVNVYGSGARRTLKGGKGSGDVNTRYNISIEEGLALGGFSVTTKDWMDRYDELVAQGDRAYWEKLTRDAEAMGTSPYVLLMGRPKPPVTYDMPLEGQGELNIYVIARDTSEGMDRQPIPGDFELLDCEIRDILELAGRKEKFLLVLNTANVLDISLIMDKVENILLLCQLGAETGNIFVDILTGKTDPSGKLTTTWAKLDQYPSTKNFGMPTEVRYEEGIYVGYRWFETFGIKPMYPFGYGLGYSTFSFCPKAFKVDGNEVVLSIQVKNTGRFAGKEVLQVYYSLPGKADVPSKQLIAYGKTKLLQPGEEQSLQIRFDMTRAASYCEENRAFVLTKGRYLLHVGTSIADTVCVAAVRVEQSLMVEKVHPLTGGDVQNLIFEGAAEDQMPLLGEKSISPAVYPHTKSVHTAPQWLEGLSNEALTALCVGVLNDMTLEHNIGASGKLVAGAAGETWSDEKIKALILADGPAGLRISPSYQLDENGRVKNSQNALAGILPGGIADPHSSEGDGTTYYQNCTAIPVGTALAQSWNDELCQAMGDLVGKEMELFGVDIWLAPAMNIHRNPLCGRNFEYYSEDPLLTGRMAAAMTRGVQRHPGCSVTVKHFCCNNQETDRFFCDSIVSTRALREIYLKAFEIGVREGRPKCLMTSYNLVNGIHTANSMELLRYVLREEWGYEGLVVTDWLATGGMGMGAKYGPSTAWGCIAAGNDLIMPGRPEDHADILAALDRGDLSREVLLECAGRIMALSEEKE